MSDWLFHTLVLSRFIMVSLSLSLSLFLYISTSPYFLSLFLCKFLSSSLSLSPSLLQKLNAEANLFGPGRLRWLQRRPLVSLLYQYPSYHSSLTRILIHSNSIYLTQSILLCLPSPLLVSCSLGLGNSSSFPLTNLCKYKFLILLT